MMLGSFVFSYSAFAQIAPDIECALFPPDNIWNARIDDLPLHPHSADFIANIGAETNVFADFGSGEWEGSPIGIPYTTVTASQPLVEITYVAYGDESDAGPFPLPPTAPIEGGADSDRDRHVLVVQDTDCHLYEVYRAFPQADDTWEADSGAFYDLTANAPLRPATFTSADAAGLPILPGLVRYEEVAAGFIGHAIRFTLENDLTRDAYVWPARHAASDSDAAEDIPMGQRFRLRTSFDISPYPPEIQVIMQAMKDYGIILADNGSSLFLSGAPDERWDNDMLRDLRDIVAADLEAVNICPLMLDPDSGQVNPSPDFTISAAACLNVGTPADS
jgi:hypothetical protein